MDKSSLKITELPALSVASENGFIPIAQVKEENDTYKTTLRALRESIMFENAYSSTAAGVLATVPGDVFFVYTDDTKEHVQGWVNSAGGATPLLNANSEQVTYGTYALLNKALKDKGAIVQWVYNGGLSNGGEQTFTVPLTGNISVQEVYVDGLRQFKDVGFELVAGNTLSFKLATPVKENQTVVAICFGSDDVEKVNEALLGLFSGPSGASNIGTLSGKTVEALLKNKVDTDVLFDEEGASGVGTKSGNNLQEELDSINAFNDDLVSTKGFSKIGNFFGAEGYEIVGDQNQSFLSRIFQRGQFELNQMPGDPSGVAGIVFGGPNNKAALVIDERGRLQIYSIVNNKLSAAQIAVPFIQGTGFFNNGFEDKVLRVPSANNESDDLSPGLLFTTNNNGIPDLFILTPNQFNDLGYPTSSSINKQMFKVVKSYDVGDSIQRTIDQAPTTENTAPVVYKLFDIDYSGYGPKTISGVLSVGNYVNYTTSSYMVTINPQNLQNSPTMDSSSIYQWLKVTSLHGTGSGWGDSTAYPSVGLVNDPTNNKVTIFLKIPAYGQKISFVPLNISNPNNVTFYYSDIRNNNSIAEPAGIIYSFAEKMITDRNYVRMNTGEIRYSPGVVLRVSSDVTSRLTDKVDEGKFKAAGTFHLVNKGIGNGISVTNPSTGQYVISGCNLRGDSWKVCPPINFSGTQFGNSSYTVNIVSQGTNTFTIEIKNPSGTLANINAFDWVDLHVQPI